MGAIIRYTYQPGKSFGLRDAKLREIFSEEIQDGMRHASFLTNVIVDLGGELTTVTLIFEKPTDLKGMLELDLRMEM